MCLTRVCEHLPPSTESAKSPIRDVGRGSLATPAGNLLRPPQKIPFTPSFEDLASVAAGLSSPLPPNESSSNESLEEAGSPVGGAREREAGLRGEHTSPVPWRRKLQLQTAETREKRGKFKKLRHSSADILLHGRDEGVEGGSSRSGSMPSERDGLQERRKILLKIHQASESDPTFSSSLPRRQGEDCLPRTASSMVTVHKSAAETEGELRPRHIYKATGNTRI